MRHKFIIGYTLAVLAWLGALWFATSIIPSPEPVPCSTDWDCCERNPRTCLEYDPTLYRQVHGGLEDEE